MRRNYEEENNSYEGEERENGGKGMEIFIVWLHK